MPITRSALPALVTVVALAACTAAPASPPPPGPTPPPSPAPDAAAFTWTRVPIGGGGMSTGVKVHPTAPDVVFSRQDVSGLLEWDEAAHRWTQRLDWMPVAFANAKGTAALAFDPGAGREDIVYAAFGQYPESLVTASEANAVWRSSDRGRTWTRVFAPPPVTPPDQPYERLSGFGSNVRSRVNGEAIAVDPQNSAVVYVGTLTSGLYRTVNALDAAPAFSRIPSVPNGAPRAGVNVIVDPRGGTIGSGSARRSRVVYATYPRVDAGFDGGVWRSVDGGDSFARTGGTNEPATISRAALGPDGSLIAASSDLNGLRRWDGSNWSVLPGTSARSFTAVAADARNPAWIAAIADGPAYFSELWRSKDGGASWTVAGRDNGRLVVNAGNYVDGYYAGVGGVDLALDPHHPGRAYWSEPFAVLRTGDVWAATVTAEPLVSGAEVTVNFALAAPPTAATGVELLSGFADVRGFRHARLDAMPADTIGGRTFDNANYVSDVGFAPSDPRLVVAVRPDLREYNVDFTDGLPRVYVSRDAGATWEERLGPPADARSTAKSRSAGGAKIAISATDPDRAVFWGANRAPYFTENLFSGNPVVWTAGTGVAWNLLEDTSPYQNGALRVTADAVDGRTFYVSRLAQGNKDLAGDTAGGKVVPVWVSHDGGRTWAVPSDQASPPAPDWPNWQERVFLRSVRTPGDPTPQDGELWLSAGRSGLYRSTGGASGFTRVNAGAVERVLGFAFGPGASAPAGPALYVAGRVNGEDGVFLSEDLGRTFRCMTGALEPLVGGVGVRDMTADPDVFGRVFVGTDGTGVLVSNPR